MKYFNVKKVSKSENTLIHTEIEKREEYFVSFNHCFQKHLVPTMQTKPDPHTFTNHTHTTVPVFEYCFTVNDSINH